MVEIIQYCHNLVILFQAQSIEEKEIYLKTCMQERW